MTRRQLAQASETSERYLAQIESGAGNPSVSVLRAIAQALDLPAAALLPESGARTAELGAIHDLLAQVPEKELPRAGQGDRGARGAARRRRPCAAHRARRLARRRQVDAWPHARAASRLAVHRARPARRRGLRRQHSRSDRNGRHGDVPPPGARCARARDRRARSRHRHHRRRHCFEPRDLRAAAPPHPHGLDQGAAGRTYEPGHGAGRLPPHGAEPRRDGRPCGDPGSAARRLRARRSRGRHLRRCRGAELCQAFAHRHAVARAEPSRDARRRRLSRPCARRGSNTA